MYICILEEQGALILARAFKLSKSVWNINGLTCKKKHVNWVDYDYCPECIN